MKKEQYKLNPWLSMFYHAMSRCTNKKNKRYYCYGGRGIKFLLSVQEIRDLWFRDKAHLMKSPSIDRIDADGNYCFENCRFIEKVKNIRRFPNALGASWHKRDKKWTAKISVNGKRTILGYFYNREDARAAYLRAKEGQEKNDGR